MRCSNCGNLISENDAFCAICGEKVQQPQQYRSVNYDARDRNNNAAMIVLTVTIAMLLIVVLGLFIAIKVGVFSNNTNDTVETVNTVTYVTERPEAYVRPSEPIRVYDTAHDQYIFESDRYYISEYDLSRLSRDDVRLILNEIYARHGFIFQMDVYRNYFMGKSWYHPRYSSNSDVEAMFNSVEKANVATIVNYEKAKGWR